MISVPKDSTIPGVPTNLKLYASYETVMFVFDNGADTDLSSYEYELYNQSQISGTAGNYTATFQINPTLSLQSSATNCSLRFWLLVLFNPEFITSME